MNKIMTCFVIAAAAATGCDTIKNQSTVPADDTAAVGQSDAQTGDAPPDAASPGTDALADAPQLDAADSASDAALSGDVSGDVDTVAVDALDGDDTAAVDPSEQLGASGYLYTPGEDELAGGSGDCAGPANALHVAVPWISQVPPGDWPTKAKPLATQNCWAAAYAMAAASLGGPAASSAEIKAIDDWMAAKFWNKFANASNNYNGKPESSEHTAQLAVERGKFLGSKSFKAGTCQQLSAELAAGRAVLVVVEPQPANPSQEMKPGTEGHFMVLVGMDSTYVYVNDPGRGPPLYGCGASKASECTGRKYTLASFDAIWKKHGAAGVFVRPNAVDGCSTTCGNCTICDPPSGQCIPDDSMTCDDSNACTTNDHCSGGTCTGGKLGCDDGLICTDDSCAAGGCKHQSNSGNCDDGNACTVGDSCAGGSCIAGALKACNDNNPCTVDSCSGGACQFLPVSDGTSCSGGACQAGTCTAPSPCAGKVCDGPPNSQCYFSSGTCDSVTGECNYSAKSSGALCDDGNACTSNDACNYAGVCAGTGACETCNGVDDDLDGIVDNPASCWKTVYRFQAANGARCWGTSDVSPPIGCAGYTYEIEAFIVSSSAGPNKFEGRQCSSGPDHILVGYGTADFNALVSVGYDCSVSLGYFYQLGAAPPSGHTPWANTCPLYRFSFSTSGGGAHLFTRGADGLNGMSCEPPARADVFSNASCFGAKPSGC